MHLSVRLLLTALLVVPVLGGNAWAGGPPDPFRGTWVSIDSVDGSSQSLHFGGAGTTRRASLYDDFASSCGEDPESAAVAVGTADVTATTAVVVYEVHCLSTGARFTSVPITYTYDAGGDTLTEGGTVWTRPGA